MSKSLILRLAGAAGLILLALGVYYIGVISESFLAVIAAVVIAGAGVGTPFRSPWLGAGVGVLLFAAGVVWTAISLVTDGLPPQD